MTRGGKPPPHIVAQLVQRLGDTRLNDEPWPGIVGTTFRLWTTGTVNTAAKDSDDGDGFWQPMRLWRIMTEASEPATEVDDGWEGGEEAAGEEAGGVGGNTAEGSLYREGV